MAYKFVGKSVPRLEGAEKVSGKTRYAADVDIPNALWAKLLRSPLPHARILKVDTSKAAKLPSRAVITGVEIPAVLTGLRMKDMPVLARDRVRYVGEPIATVAADSAEVAEEALNLIDVQYEELPYITDPLKAIEPGAPVLHDNPAGYKNAPERAWSLPNIQSYGQWSNGDVEAGFKKAARVFEHTFRTPLGFHAYIDRTRAPSESMMTVKSRSGRQTKRPSHCATAWRAIWISIRRKSKCISCPWAAISAARLPSSKCRFVISWPSEPANPSRWCSTTLRRWPPAHRHPAVITLRTAVDADGKLCALHARALFGGGGYAALKANAEVTVQGPRRVAFTIESLRSKSKRSALTPIKFPARRRAPREARRRLLPWSRRSISSPANWAWTRSRFA